MVINELLDIIKNNNLSYNKVTRYLNCAYTVKLDNGTLVYCYDNGNVRVQGKHSKEVKKIIYNDKKYNEINNNVFITFGQDDSANTELKLVLKNLQMNPLRIDELPSSGRTIIEQLEHTIKQASSAIVLATPDDEFFDSKDNHIKRARQNVILEMGMLISHLGRSKVIIIFKEDEEFERPSDIDGVLFLRYKDSVTELKNKIKRELYSHNGGK